MVADRALAIGNRGSSGAIDFLAQGDSHGVVALYRRRRCVSRSLRSAEGDSTDPIVTALTLAGSFAASALALVRFTLRENRSISDRFTNFLEGSLSRQEATNASFQTAIERLVETVKDNSALLNRILESVNR
jgi:hypothetical protein